MAFLGGPGADPDQYPLKPHFGRAVQPDQDGNPSQPGIYPYREVFYGAAAGPGKNHRPS